MLKYRIINNVLRYRRIYYMLRYRIINMLRYRIIYYMYVIIYYTCLSVNSLLIVIKVALLEFLTLKTKKSEYARLVFFSYHHLNSK